MWLHATATSLVPQFENGAVTINTFCVFQVAFRRGDCNDDGVVDIADVIANIGLVTGAFSFVAGCSAACDANHDGAIDLSDSVYIAAYQFQMAPPPPAPFPNCGEEDGVDDTHCVFSSCP
ncbi:MAG: dockerin type I repeat-containing protein [Planctomycetota bacterium]